MERLKAIGCGGFQLIDRECFDPIRTQIANRNRLDASHRLYRRSQWNFSKQFYAAATTQALKGEILPEHVRQNGQGKARVSRNTI